MHQDPPCDSVSRIQTVLDTIVQEASLSPELGQVANYIPELACIDPDQFALSVCTAEGAQFNAGDSNTRFSIQSISKVFTLAIALGQFGSTLWNRVGREPSTNAFNSMIELELEAGKPRNPFVNAGAIVVADMLLSGREPKEALAEILRFVRAAADDEDIFMDHALARSERDTGHRNWSLAHFLTASGNLHHDCAKTLGTYFHQCALEMTCSQLAKSGRFLAGLGPSHNLIPAAHVRSINAVMLTCGHYDGSGEFAYRVGFPGKSGVGGGILAVVPGKASIAVWSPGLNANGNSLRGAAALEKLSNATGWSIFTAGL
ncbi:MAG: glutaminase [Granulosicoccaceae bacterium]